MSKNWLSINFTVLFNVPIFFLLYEFSFSFFSWVCLFFFTKFVNSGFTLSLFLSPYNLTLFFISFYSTITEKPTRRFIHPKNVKLWTINVHLHRDLMKPFGFDFLGGFLQNSLYNFRVITKITSLGNLFCEIKSVIIRKISRNNAK